MSTKNEHFTQKSKFRPKMNIFSKIEISTKNEQFAQKSKFRPKMNILLKNLNFAKKNINLAQKIEISVKIKKFTKNLNFGSKSRILNFLSQDFHNCLVHRRRVAYLEADCGTWSTVSKKSCLTTIPTRSISAQNLHQLKTK